MLATFASRPLRHRFLFLLFAACCVLQPKAPRLVASLPHAAPLVGVSFGSQLVTTDGGRAVAFDPTTGQKQAELVTGERLGGVGHGPQGQVAVTGLDGVTLFDKGLKRVARVEGSARDAAYSADGKLLAVAFDSGAGLYDAATGQLKVSLGEGGERVQFRRDGKRLMVRSQDTAVIYNGAGQFVRSWYASDFSWSPDGKRFAVLRGKKLDVGTGDESVAWTLALDSLGYQVEFSPDSKLLLLRKDRVVYVLETAKGKLAGRLDYATPVTAARFHPKKPWLAVGAGGEVTVREVRTGKSLFESLKAGSAVTCLAFDAAGKRLAIGEKSAVCSLWELP